MVANLVVIGSSYIGDKFILNCSNHLNICLLKHIKNHNTYINEVNEVIDDPNITHVIICGIYSDFDLLYNCLNKGKHILFEPPLNLLDDQIEQLFNLASDKKSIFHINYYYAFDEVLAELSDKTLSDDIQQVVLVNRFNKEAEHSFNLVDQICMQHIYIICQILKCYPTDIVSSGNSKFLNLTLIYPDDIIFTLVINNQSKQYDYRLEFFGKHNAFKIEIPSATTNGKKIDFIMINNDLIVKSLNYFIHNTENTTVTADVCIFFKNISQTIRKELKLDI